MKFYLLYRETHEAPIQSDCFGAASKQPSSFCQNITLQSCLLQFNHLKFISGGRKKKTEISKGSSDNGADIIHYNLRESILALLMMLVLVTRRLYGFHLKELKIRFVLRRTKMSVTQSWVYKQKVA